MSGDWSSLLPELLQEIASRIKIYSDYVRFRAVCVSWRSSTPASPTHLPPQPPWLMLPHGGNHSSSTTNHRAFFDPIGRKYHRLPLSEPLHHRYHCRGASHGWLIVLDHHHRCRGSSHGWLVILDESPDVVILNPLTGTKLNLPPLSALPQVFRFDYSNVGREYVLRSPDQQPLQRVSLREMRDSFIRKFILSGSPSRNPDSFTALAILNRNGDLVHCKSGQDDHWTSIPGTRNIEDAVYYKEMVYALEKNGSITICDVTGDSPVIIAAMQIVGLDHGGDTCYLVPTCDELLLVTRFFDEVEMGAYETRRFNVYRLRSKRWEKVNDLGKLALFLGGNSCSSAINACDFPGCEENSIYFTDDDGELDYNDGLPGEHDMGIFRLEDGTIQRLPCDHRVSLAHPVWITPSSF